MRGTIFAFKPAHTAFKVVLGVVGGLLMALGGQTVSAEPLSYSYDNYGAQNRLTPMSVAPGSSYRPTTEYGSSTSWRGELSPVPSYDRVTTSYSTIGQTSYTDSHYYSQVVELQVCNSSSDSVEFILDGTYGFLSPGLCKTFADVEVGRVLQYDRYQRYSQGQQTVTVKAETTAFTFTDDSASYYTGHYSPHNYLVYGNSPQIGYYKSYSVDNYGNQESRVYYSVGSYSSGSAINVIEYSSR